MGGVDRWGGGVLVLVGWGWGDRNNQQTQKEADSFQGEVRSRDGEQERSQKRG